YDAAHEILKLYVQEDIGYERIAYYLNEQGWPFCDRKNNPRPIDREDVRRVLGAWPEYGGVVLEMKARDRRGHGEDLDMAAFPFRPERAGCDTALLREGARLRRARSRRPGGHGVSRGTYPYARSNITYCAHCMQRAQEENDARLYSTLG